LIDTEKREGQVATFAVKISVQAERQLARVNHLAGGRAGGELPQRVGTDISYEQRIGERKE
jgi:hypothetical protein